MTALVLDAAMRQALVMVRELGRAGVPVVAADAAAGAPAFASRWCGRHAVLPELLERPDDYVAAVLALCAEHDVEVVIACHDGTIDLLRTHRGAFAGVAALALASEPGLAVAVDKERTLSVAHELGIAVPRGAVVSSADEAAAVLDDIGLPVVVKPTQSWLGEGSSRPRLGPALASTREDALAIVADIAGSGVPVAVQAWLPGDRDAIDVMYADGRCRARFAQRADRMLPVIGGSAVVRESIPLPDDETVAAQRLVEAIGLEGYSEVEFRRDADGTPVLMEINARPTAGIEVAVRAGVPFPRMIFDHAAGRPVAEAAGGYRTGLRMRWLGGDVLWLAQTLAETGTHPDVLPATVALGTFFGDFFRRSGYDYLDRHDLAPAGAALRAAIGGIPERLRSALRRRRERRAHRVPPAAGELEVAIEELGDRDDLGRRWRALEERADAAPYLSWDWLSAWLAVYAPRRPAVVRVGPRDAPVALGLIERRAGGRWEFAGLPVTPVRGLLVAPADREAAWAALGEELHRRRGGWASLGLEGVPGAAAALPGARLTPSPSWVVDLPSSFDAYLAQRTPNQRKAHKQKLRRLGPAGGEVVLVDEADHPAMLQAFLDLHHRRAASKGERHPQMDADLAAMLGRLGGRLQLFALRLDGEVAGVTVRVDGPGGAAFYNSGYDPARSRLGLGVLLELASIGDAIDRGHRRFDLGPGLWRYKTDLGGREEPLFDGDAFCPSPQGRVLRRVTIARRALAGLRPGRGVVRGVRRRRALRRARTSRGPSTPG